MISCHSGGQIVSVICSFLIIIAWAGSGEQFRENIDLHQHRLTIDCG